MTQRHWLVFIGALLEVSYAGAAKGPGPGPAQADAATDALSLRTDLEAPGATTNLEIVSDSAGRFLFINTRERRASKSSAKISTSVIVRI